MSGISLEPNEPYLPCDEYIKVLNKLMKAKNLSANLSQEEVFDQSNSSTPRYFNMPWVLSNALP